MEDLKKTAISWGNWFGQEIEVAAEKAAVAAEKAAMAANEKANGTILAVAARGLYRTR